MATGPRLVNKQFNSPIGLYSQSNIQDTLNKQTQVLNNGAMGIDFNNPVNTKPSNLANSAVLRMLEEEEQRQRSGQGARYRRDERDRDPFIRRIDRTIDWPPKPATDQTQINMNNTYSAKFFRPKTEGTKRVAWPPPAEETNGQEGESEAPVQRQATPVKLHQSPALTRLIPIEREGAPFSPPESKVYSPQPKAFSPQPKTFSPQPMAFSPQPKHQSPASTRLIPIEREGAPFSPPKSKPYSPQPKAYSPQPPLGSPQPHTPTQTFPPPFPDSYSTFPRKTQSSFAPVSPRGYGAQPFESPKTLPPVTSQVYAPVPFQQPYSPYNPSPTPSKYGETRVQQPGAPAHYVAPNHLQFEEPPPSTVTLRPSAPIHQKPAPIVASQPAANSFKGGVNMRGDQKWPPQSVKEAVEAENFARISLAKGPACRPRKVKKDYSSFFAKNALPHNYPGYKVPPGTQHYDDQTGTSQF